MSAFSNGLEYTSDTTLQLSQGTNAIALRDLIDPAKLQQLTNHLYEATGIPTALITIEGEVLVGSGWQSICVDFHRRNKEVERACIESDTAMKAEIGKGEPYSIYRCPRGLTDACIPIKIEGQHLGNMFTGQFFTEAPTRETEERFRNQAKDIGANEEDYLKAMRKVPVFSLEQVKANLLFLGELTEYIAKQGFANLEMKRNNARLDRHLKLMEYSPKDIQDFVDHALTHAIELTESKIGYIYFYSEEKREFILNSWSKEVMHSCRIAQKQTIYKLDSTGIWGEAVRQRRAIVVNDFAAPNPLKKGYPEGHSHLSRFLTLPVFSGEKIVAVVGVANKKSEYTEVDQRQLTLLMQSVWKKVEAERAAVERKIMQTQLLHASKLAAIGTLAAGVAHEINNPLSIIGGNISIIEDQVSKLGGDAKIGLALEKQSLSLERIVNIVNGLRTMARSDSESIEPVDIHKAVKDTLSLCEPIFAKKGMTIKTDLNSKRACIFGNVGKLQQVIMNLIQNAEDACEGLSRNGVIAIETVDDGKWVVLKISDNGAGISAEHIPRLCEPFFTTKPAGKGTGLGLPISQSIIQSFGGSLKVESNLGQGAVFIVTFPSGEADREPKSDNVIIPQPSERRYVGKVLVVDDEADIRDILARFISRLGFTVTTANDGVDALEILKDVRFDYLITDIKMPRMSGVALLENVQKLSHLRDMFKVVVTGGVVTEFSQRDRDSLHAIAQLLIRKPFSKEDITAIFQAVPVAKVC